MIVSARWKDIEMMIIVCSCGQEYLFANYPKLKAIAYDFVCHGCETMQFKIDDVATVLDEQFSTCEVLNMMGVEVKDAEI